MHGSAQLFYTQDLPALVISTILLSPQFFPKPHAHRRRSLVYLPLHVLGRFSIQDLVQEHLHLGHGTGIRAIELAE